MLEDMMWDDLDDDDDEDNGRGKRPRVDYVPHRPGEEKIPLTNSISHRKCPISPRYTVSERTEMSLPPLVPNFRDLANCVPVPRTRTEANRESCDLDRDAEEDI
ncbi:hypothetical protein LXL04_039005 [Taraxacum kok-saghyz]